MGYTFNFFIVSYKPWSYNYKFISIWYRETQTVRYRATAYSALALRRAAKLAHRCPVLADFSGSSRQKPNTAAGYAFGKYSGNTTYEKTGSPSNPTIGAAQQRAYRVTTGLEV